VSNQLGAQFSFSIAPAGGQGPFVGGGSVLDTSRRNLATPAGTLRIGQTLYIIIDATNDALIDRQIWIMPWWLHPTFEFRYPGQNGYTAQDTLLFGPQNPFSIALQDSLWMTSPKRFDIVGPPSPAGTSISDMQSDIWVIDVPAGGTVRKAFFYPSHGYGLAYTYQTYNEGEIDESTASFSVSVTPGALHAVFQDGQG
jgi:hypothetical protein